MQNADNKMYKSFKMQDCGTMQNILSESEQFFSGIKEKEAHKVQALNKLFRCLARMQWNRDFFQEKKLRPAYTWHIVPSENTAEVMNKKIKEKNI
jgi:hypothetical protein